MMKLIKETIAPLYTRMRYFSRAQYNGLALFKTIWFNLRALPWRQARKLPIFIYRGTKVYHCGTFKITAEHVVCGMIQIGKLGYKAPGNGRIANYGIIEFKAPTILWGGVIIENRGYILFHGETRVGEGTTMLIRDRLEIGKYTSIGFLSFFMDCDDHFTVNTDTLNVTRNKQPIVIGRYCWIACKTFVKKGVVLPDYTIVASANAVLTKDYSDIGEYCVLGGVPAKVIGRGIRRIYNWKAEARLKEYFDEHPEATTFDPGIAGDQIDEYCLSNAIHL